MVSSRKQPQGENGPLLGTKRASKGLNPDAPSFTFSPAAKPFVPPPSPQQGYASASSGVQSNYATPAASVDSLPPQLSHGVVSSKRIGNSPSSAIPTGEESSRPSPIPAKNVSTESSTLAKAPSQNGRHDTNHESDSDSGSDFSFDSVLPTRRSFRLIHLLLQFPISLLFILIFALSLGLWKHQVRWDDIATGAVAWLATETLKEVVFECLTWESKRKDGTLIQGSGLAFPTAVHCFLQDFVRLGGILVIVALLPEPISIALNLADPLTQLSPALLIPQHPSPGPKLPSRRPLPPVDTLFFSSLWFALGWATAEITWRSWGFWKAIKLYDDVLPTRLGFDEDDEEEEIGRSGEQDGDTDDDEGYSGLPNQKAYGTIDNQRPPNSTLYQQENKSTVPRILSPGFRYIEDDAVVGRLEREEEEAEVELQIRNVERDVVEARLGVPLYEIPVGVVLIWRLDSILLSIVLSLFMSLPFRTSAPSLVAFPLWPTFFFTTASHILISLLWVLRVKFAGIPSVSFATLVLLLFFTFAGLGAWGALE